MNSTASNQPDYTVGIIDIGSNTIKGLVGARIGHSFATLFSQTVECRISKGMYGNEPRITESAMVDSTNAIRAILESLRSANPQVIEIVATSAVRDASNGTEFVGRIEKATGIRPRILSGFEEAEGIARGIREEPGLDPSQGFSVSDLGGGSLEWIVSDREDTKEAISFDLGAVRLLHKFHPQAEHPIPMETRRMIRQHCLDVLGSALTDRGDHFPSVHWGTGGAFTIMRAILAAEANRTFEEQSREIPIEAIQRWEEKLSALSQEERSLQPGLPAQRSDIFPVALTILLALSEWNGARSYHHSFYNLRVGRAARLLDQNR